MKVLASLLSNRLLKLGASFPVANLKQSCSTSGLLQLGPTVFIHTIASHGTSASVGSGTLWPATRVEICMLQQPLPSDVALNVA